MTATLAQSPQPEARHHVHTRRLKSNRPIAEGGGSLADCGGDDVRNRIFQCTSLYVKMLSTAMDRSSAGANLREISQLSDAWLKSMKLSLSCEGTDDMVSKVEGLLLHTRTRAELAPGLLTALILQAKLLALASERGAPAHAADPPDPPPPPLRTEFQFSSPPDTPREDPPRDRIYSDIPLPRRESGVDVPQIDLDELLLPNSQSVAFSRPLRQGLEHTLRKRYRARSNSDFSAYKQMDLRPPWMRSPRLYKAVIKKMQGNSLPPLYYVEWNILGLKKAVDRKESVRIVSPKFTTFSANPAARHQSLGPLRIMVALERDDSGDQEEQRLRMGIYFTLASDVEVSYRLFHPDFLSESRKHCFRTTPWAGLGCAEIGVVEVPLSEVVTVGVAIESLSGGGQQVECGLLPSVSSIMNSYESLEAFCADVSGFSGKVYARRTMGDLIADAKLPLQQSLSRMSLSSSCDPSGANKELFANIWSDCQYQ